MIAHAARHVLNHPARLWWTAFLTVGFVFALPPTIALAFAT